MATEKQLKYWESLKGKKPKNMGGLKLGQGWNKKEQKVEMVSCACGCGKQLNKYDKKNRIRKSLSGHLLKFAGGGFEKGHKTWNKGTKGLMVSWNRGLTKEIDERVRRGAEKMRGHEVSKETRGKIGKGRLSIRWSEEDKQRLSRIGKERGHGKWMIGKYNSSHYLEMGRKGFERLQRREPTSIEVKVYKELKAKGFLFEKQKIINGKFIVDAYIPSLNLVIEADGVYWHSLPKVIARDKAKNAYLTKCGYNLLRLTETEINSGQFKERIGVKN